MEIKDRVVVVTGAGSGLGEATARTFAPLGARLALIDLARERLERIASELDARAFAFDVAHPGEAERAIGEIEADLGTIGVLVNCAGVATPGRLVGRSGPLDLAAFEAVIRVNLLGSVNMMRLAAASMMRGAPDHEGERGVIVNTSSVAAFDGQIGQTAYAASKGAIASLTLPAAREFAAAGIRVVAVAPGLFGTPLLLGMPQTVQDSLAATVPFPQRFGRPGEFADLVLAICRNPMINGTTIRLDGALRMAAR